MNDSIQVGDKVQWPVQFLRKKKEREKKPHRSGTVISVGKFCLVKVEKDYPSKKGGRLACVAIYLLSKIDEEHQQEGVNE